jgi:hypothetical protein
MTVPYDPPQMEELVERWRRAKAAARRAEVVGIALRMVFLLTWLYILWSCRDGCSENSWALVAVYPVLVVYYLIVRKRALRRILSEMPEYQEALAQQQKERNRDQVQ